MPDTDEPIINTLEAALLYGRAEANAIQQRAEKAAVALAAARDEEYRAAWATVCAFCDATWPYLAGAFHFPPLDPNKHYESQLPGPWNDTITLVVPGLTHITVKVISGNGRREDWRFDEPALTFQRAMLRQSEFGNEAFAGRDKNNTFSTYAKQMPLALAVAEDDYEMFASYQREAEEANAKRAERRAANAAAASKATPDQQIADHWRELVRLSNPDDGSDGN